MLSDFAVRLIFQQAIRNKTFAQNRVLNQPVDALTRVVDEEQAPTPAIAVFSGEATHKVHGQDIFGFEDSKSTLTVTYFVPPSSRVTLDGREVTVEGGAPLAAFVLDTMIYQSRAALMDLENPWGRLWPLFVTKVDQVSISPPFLEAAAGDIRVFMRGMVFDYCPLRDPVPGKAMSSSWQKLYDLMMQDNGLRHMAPLIKTAIEQPTISADWQRAMMQLGISDQAGENVGIRPLEPTGDELTDAGLYNEDPEDTGPLVGPDPDEPPP